MDELGVKTRYAGRDDGGVETLQRRAKTRTLQPAARGLPWSGIRRPGAQNQSTASPWMPRQAETRRPGWTGPIGNNHDGSDDRIDRSAPGAARCDKKSDKSRQAAAEKLSGCDWTWLIQYSGPYNRIILVITLRILIQSCKKNNRLTLPGAFSCTVHNFRGRGPLKKESATGQQCQLKKYLTSEQWKAILQWFVQLHQGKASTAPGDARNRIRIACSSRVPCAVSVCKKSVAADAKNAHPGPADR